MEKHLMDAMDNYPYNLADAVESLNYALSVNPASPEALVLKGKIYAEQMYRYDQALECYEEALCEDVCYAVVYPHYIYALLSLGKHKRAEAAIDYALTLAGSNKTLLMSYKVMSYEMTGRLKKAAKHCDKAIAVCLEDSCIERLKETKARIKGKIKAKKK